MRRRDENKKEAIFRATIELLNEIGFSDISMSKIAKRAGVSVATIYIYFDSKDDMLRKLYLNVKQKLATSLVGALDENLSFHENVMQAMRRGYDFIVANREDFLFMEQFSNSPLLQNLNIGEEVSSFKLMQEILRMGVQKGILKQVDESILMAYCYLPIAQLAKIHIKTGVPITEKMIQNILDMSWDAIKVSAKAPAECRAVKIT